MAKAQVKLELKALTNPEVIVKGRAIVTAATGKPLAPAATLTAITNALNALEAKGVEIANHDQQGQTLTSQQKTLRTTADGLLTTFGSTIEDGSGGVASVILEYGLDVRDPSTTPIGALAQPQNFVALHGDNPGEIDTDWDSVRGTKIYEVQVSPDPITTTSWTTVASVTKSKATISGLTSGAKMWFRVRAIGTAGPSPWSDPATKVVP